MSRAILIAAMIGAMLAAAQPAEKAGPGGRLRGIRWPSFNRTTGEKEWELTADAADPLGNNVFDLTNPSIFLISKDREAQISARAGTVDRNTGIVDLKDDVVLQMTDDEGTRVETTRAQWDARKRVASSTENVVITRKSMIITGRGFAAGSEPGAKDSQPTALVIHKAIRALVKATGSTANLFAPMQDRKTDDKAPPAEDIVITSDGPLEFDRARNVASFSNNARVEKGDGWLTAERLAVFTDPKTNKLCALLAAGSVVMSDPVRDGGGSGDRLLWEAAAGSGKLSGAPAMTWMGEVRIDAPEITFSAKDQSIQWQRRALMLLPSGTLPTAWR